MYVLVIDMAKECIRQLYYLIRNEGGAQQLKNEKSEKSEKQQERERKAKSRGFWGAFSGSKGKFYFFLN